MLLLLVFFVAAFGMCGSYDDGHSLPHMGSHINILTAYKGQTIVLPCQVSGAPVPYAEWYKDGIPVSSDWKRFSYKRLNLHIRDIHFMDSGLYQCKAVNGYGMRSISVQLKVNDADFSADATKEESFVDSKEAVKPVFSQPIKMRRHNIVKPCGSTVTFKCKAKGKPRPKIQWFRNDGNFTLLENTLDFTPNRQWSLTLHDIKPRDSGHYTCHVWNDAGDIHFHYHLQVVGNSHEKPHLVKPHPKNTTVIEGERASLRCKVRSNIPPTIKWIKRIGNPRDTFQGKLPNNSLQVDKKVYLILPTQEMSKLTDGSYLNKLFIRKATKQDSGMYICLGANTMGYNLRYAYLTVVSRDVNSAPQLRNPQPNLSMPAIVGVPAASGLIIAFSLVIYCIYKRDQANRQKYRKDHSVGRNSESVKQCLTYIEDYNEGSKLSYGAKLELRNLSNLDIAKHSYSIHQVATATFTSSLLNDSNNTCCDEGFPITPPPPPPSQYSRASSTDLSANNISSGRYGYNKYDHYQ